jgi:hypothetical protein
VRNKPKPGCPGVSGGRRVGGAYRVKQSQLAPLDGVRWGRPNSQRAGAGSNKPSGPERILRNKANSARAAGVPGPILRNKPNFPQTHRAKQSQFARTGPGGRRARAVVQTKPIPPVGRGCRGRNVTNKAKLRRVGVSGGKGGSSRAILPNKANSPIRPAASADHLYKQSQFPPRCQDRQGLGRKGVMVNSTSDRPRQNKANSRAAANRAKQTQFFDCGPGSASKVTTLWTGHRPAMGHPARAARPGANCTNKPNLRPPSTLRPRPRHRMPTAWSVSGGVTFCLNPQRGRGYNHYRQP